MYTILKYIIFLKSSFLLEILSEHISINDYIIQLIVYNTHLCEQF